MLKNRFLLLGLLSLIALTLNFSNALAATKGQSNQQVIEKIQALNAQEDYPAAFSLGHQNLENLAGNPEFDLAFGTAAANVGEEDHAIFAFERVLVYQKDLQAARENLALSHIKKGNLTAANKHLSQTNKFNTLAAAANLQAINPYLSHKSLQYLNHKIANRKAMFIANLGVGAGMVSSERGLNSTYSQPVLTQAISYPSSQTGTYNTYTLGSSLLFAFTPRFGMQALVQADATNPHSFGELEEVTYAGQTEFNFYVLGNSWALSFPLNLGVQQREINNLPATAEHTKHEYETLSASIKAFKKLGSKQAVLLLASLIHSEDRPATRSSISLLEQETKNEFGYFQLKWFNQATPNWLITTSFGGGTKGEQELKGCWSCDGIALDEYLHPSLSRLKTFNLNNTWRLSQIAKLNLGAGINSGQLTNFKFFAGPHQEQESHTFNLIQANLGLEVTSRSLWQTRVDINQFYTRTTASSLENTNLTNINLAIKKLW